MTNTGQFDIFNDSFQLRVARGLSPAKLIYFLIQMSGIFSNWDKWCRLYLNWGEFDSSFYWTILLHLAVNFEFYNFPPVAFTVCIYEFLIFTIYSNTIFFRVKNPAPCITCIRLYPLTQLAGSTIDRFLGGFVMQLTKITCELRRLLDRFVEI